MYIHYMIHVSINFPPSRKMNIKHFSRITGLAIFQHIHFSFSFFDVTFALLSALIFTHKTPNHLRSPAQHGTSSLASGLKRSQLNSEFSPKNRGRFPGMKFPAEVFFLWNACLVNILAKGFALLIQVGGELQWQTTQPYHVKPLADVCHGKRPDFGSSTRWPC